MHYGQRLQSLNLSNGSKYCLLCSISASSLLLVIGNNLFVARFVLFFSFLVVDFIFSIFSSISFSSCCGVRASFFEFVSFWIIFFKILENNEANSCFCSLFKLTLIASFCSSDLFLISFDDFVECIGKTLLRDSL